MFIFIVFWLGSDHHFSCFFRGIYTVTPKGSVTGCDSSLGRGWVDGFLFFDCLSTFYFWLFEFHYTFFPSRYNNNNNLPRISPSNEEG